MKLVSFYCDVDGGTYYADCSSRLKKECDALGVDHLILEENFGKDWIDNVRAKPIFLLKMLNELNQDFVWLDVDCNIKRKLDFTIKGDWMVDFKTGGNPHDYVHCIKNNEGNKIFLQRWIEEIENKKRGSHTAFINIYKSLNYSAVPANYFSLGLSQVQSKKKYMNG